MHAAAYWMFLLIKHRVAYSSTRTAQYVSFRYVDVNMVRALQVYSRMTPTEYGVRLLHMEQTDTQANHTHKIQ